MYMCYNCNYHFSEDVTECPSVCPHCGISVDISTISFAELLGYPKEVEYTPQEVIDAINSILDSNEESKEVK